MADLSQFPVTKRWPAQNPDILQVYAYGTPNGRKVPIALEEMGIAYEYHSTGGLSDDIMRSPEFLSVSPNNKIPAILDPNGPDGAPITLFESGAILQYLAEKSGKFAGNTASEKFTVYQWLMWQMAGLGPMFGQLGFFYKFAGASMEDPTARNRYIGEAKRILNVLNTQLDGRDWVAGDYSIADMAIAPWLKTLEFYEAKDVLEYSNYKNVVAYEQRFYDRPAVQRGVEVTV